MSRTLTASIRRKLNSGSFSTATLIQIAFSEGKLRYTDAGHDLEYDGATWSAEGLIEKVGSVTQTSTLNTSKFSLTLSAASDSHVGIFLNRQYTDVQITYWRAFMGSDLLIGPDDVLLYFDGRISTLKRTNTKSKSTFALGCTSRLEDLKRTNGVITNDRSQQAIFPGDKGFEYASEPLEDRQWGRG